MKKKFAAIVGAVAIALTLSACNSGAADKPIGGDIIAPVTENIGDLQGASVELKVGQVLNINTGDIPVDGYEGEAADPAIAEFTPGRTDGSAEFNPGFTAKAPGTTEATMTATQGGIQAVTFTITVK